MQASVLQALLNPFWSFRDSEHLRPINPLVEFRSSSAYRPDTAAPSDPKPSCGTRKNPANRTASGTSIRAHAAPSPELPNGAQRHPQMLSPLRCTTANLLGTPVPEVAPQSPGPKTPSNCSIRKEGLNYRQFLKEFYIVTFKFPKHLQIMANRTLPRTKFTCGNKGERSCSLSKLTSCSQRIINI